MRRRSRTPPASPRATTTGTSSGPPTSRTRARSVPARANRFGTSTDSNPSRLAARVGEDVAALDVGEHAEVARHLLVGEHAGLERLRQQVQPPRHLDDEAGA